MMLLLFREAKLFTVAALIGSAVALAAHQRSAMAQDYDGDASDWYGADDRDTWWERSSYYNENEWYDAGDWFDGNNYEFADNDYYDDDDAYAYHFDGDYAYGYDGSVYDDPYDYGIYTPFYGVRDEDGLLGFADNDRFDYPYRYDVGYRYRYGRPIYRGPVYRGPYGYGPYTRFYDDGDIDPGAAGYDGGGVGNYGYRPDYRY